MASLPSDVLLKGGVVCGLPATVQPHEYTGGAAHGGVPELARGVDLGSGRGWPGVALNEIDDVYERQVPARGEPSRARPGPGPAVLDATTPAAKPVARVS
jgi:hypothetical protein